jgi:hypothetical protein
VKPDTIRSILIRDVIEPLKAGFPTPAGELGFEHGRVHSFRHYFCSKAFIDGATESEVKEWLGHADSRMVAHYRHLRVEDGQRRMQSIDFIGSARPSQASGPANNSVEGGADDGRGSGSQQEARVNGQAS